MTNENRSVQQGEVIQSPEEAVDEYKGPTLESDRVIHEEVVQTHEGTSFKRVAEETVVLPSESTIQKAKVTRAKRIVYFIVHVFTIIIVIRFVLLALGANPESGFAAFMYGLSYPIMAPFLGLFGAPTEPQYGVNIFEFSAFFAIAIYYLLAWIITRILTFAYKPKKPLEQVSDNRGPS